MKILGVSLLAISLVLPLGSCGGGSTRATTASFNHEILSPDGLPYMAELNIAGVIMSAITQEGTEEITLASCGKMNARFLADPVAGAWIDFPDTEVLCHTRNYIWVGYDNGTPNIWISTEDLHLAPNRPVVAGPTG
jgi:hypothetical protein